jgi:hypothetical protein
MVCIDVGADPSVRPFLPVYPPGTPHKDSGQAMFVPRKKTNKKRMMAWSIFDCGLLIVDLFLGNKRGTIRNWNAEETDATDLRG